MRGIDPVRCPWLAFLLTQQGLLRQQNLREPRSIISHFCSRRLNSRLGDSTFLNPRNIMSAPEKADDQSEQVNVRRQKLTTLKNYGCALYPNDFRPSSTTADVVTEFGAVQDDVLAQSSADLSLAG